MYVVLECMGKPRETGTILLVHGLGKKREGYQFPATGLEFWYDLVMYVVLACVGY